jgi:amino acid transporter
LGKSVYVREATGLVKEASWFDVFMYNQASMLAAAAPIWGVGFYIYLGGDFFTMWWLSIVLSVFLVLTYYLLSCAMPRAGSDYTYDSRILHPAIGFVVAGLMGFGQALLNVVYSAVGWVSTGIAPVLLYASFATNNPSLADLAVAISSPLFYFLLATITIVGFGFILVVGGFKRFLLFENIVMVISLIGMIAMFLVCLTTPHSEFVSMFDTVAKNYGTSYSDILAKSAASGWSSPPATPVQTLMILPGIMSFTWFGMQSTAFAGEIKNIKKSNMFGMTLSVIVFATLFIAAFAACVNMIGYDFATAMANISYNNPSAISIPVLIPWSAVFFYGLASKNLAIAILIALAPMFSYLAGTGVFILVFCRFLFAMSFDRVLPEFVSRIDERFHSPRNSVILSVVISIAILAVTQVLSAVPSTSTYTLYIGLMPNALMQSTFLITAFSLAVFPYLRKELYEQVFPFKRKIAGIPIATWVGTISIGIVLYTLDIWFLQPFSPLVYGGFTWFGYLIVAFSVLMIITYYGIKAYRAHQGIDVSLAFKQIPPE